MEEPYILDSDLSTVLLVEKFNTTWTTSISRSWGDRNRVPDWLKETMGTCYQHSVPHYSRSSSPPGEVTPSYGMCVSVDLLFGSLVSFGLDKEAINKCLRTLQPSIADARKLYYGREYRDVSDDTIAMMMLYDSCFIITRLLAIYNKDLLQSLNIRDDDFRNLKEDLDNLLLLENQFPLGILRSICDFIDDNKLEIQFVAVEVVGATELMPKDGQGSANPFVEAQLLGRKLRTRIKFKDLDPQWNQTLLFAVPDPLHLSDQTLDLTVYHHRPSGDVSGGGGARVFLGRVRISAAAVSASPSSAAVQRFPLEKRGLFSRVRGDLALRLYALRENSDTAAAVAGGYQEPPPEPTDDKNAKVPSAGAPPPAPAPNVNAFSAQPPAGATVVKVQPAGATAKPDYGLIEMSPPLASTMGYRGRDTISSTCDVVEQMRFPYVNVVKARDLPNEDIEGQLQKNQHPVCRKVFAFSSNRLLSNKLEVDVKDQDFIKDDFVGQVLFRYNTPRKTFNLGNDSDHWSFITQNFFDKADRGKDFSTLLQMYHHSFITKRSPQHESSISLCCGNLELPTFNCLLNRNNTNRRESVANSVIHSATKLIEGGVVFKKKDTFGEISFRHGNLEIPCLEMHDRKIMNMLAFEQLIFIGDFQEEATISPEYRKIEKPISAVVYFLAFMIRTPNDLELLEGHGIIETGGINSVDNILKFFGKARSNIKLDSEGNNIISSVSKDINLFLDSRRIQWWGKLKKDYFNNPWTVISLLAATALLILTFLQTYFTMYPYYHMPSH